MRQSGARRTAWFAETKRATPRIFVKIKAQVTVDAWDGAAAYREILRMDAVGGAWFQRPPDFQQVSSSFSGFFGCSFFRAKQSWSFRSSHQEVREKQRHAALIFCNHENTLCVTIMYQSRISFRRYISGKLARRNLLEEAFQGSRKPFSSRIEGAESGAAHRYETNQAGLEDP